MHKDKIYKAAKILFKSRTQLKKLVHLPNDCTPANKEDAYLIQDELAHHYTINDQNTFIIGKKVGCTNKEAQKQINISEPFYGNIFSTYYSKTNCSLNNFFLKPFIEPEFSFKIKEEFDIINAPYSSEQIYKSIDSILPSIEIVDSRYEDWTTVGINNLIADNAANAYWIYGKENKNIDKFDLSDHPVSLHINELLISEGNSCNVLGNPLNSLTWLINTLVKQGKSLPKNSYVSTGTCTPAIPIKQGDTINANFGNLGNIEFKLI